MKFIKGLVLVCFLGAIISSCFNEPEFNDRPEIIFEDIYFGDRASGSDSLVLTFRFKDGDGNLGLPANAIDSPYHQINFKASFTPEKEENWTSVASYLIDDFSAVKSAKTGKTPTDISLYIDYAPKGAKILTYRNKFNGYSDLPPFQSPFSTCGASLRSYKVDTVFIATNLKSAVNSARIVDSLVTKASNFTVAYSVVDTFYNTINANHYTIDVKFFEKIGSTFQEYDWRKELCTTFDGRFTVLADKEGPLEGTISYSMKSTGFVQIFSVKPLYLEFQIRDQDLNVSNVARTREFTLADIKR